LQADDATLICYRCLTPQSEAAWFCPHCGSAVGPYNNLMPYVQVFSEGEVFRNGVSHRFRNRPLVLAGFILMVPAINPLFAPFYWFLLFKNLRQNRRSEPDESEAAGQ
jgi:hypothetical protein